MDYCLTAWSCPIGTVGYIHKPQGAPDYALPDLPYAFKSLDDYDFIDMEEPEHESEQEEPLETNGAE